MKHDDASYQPQPHHNLTISQAAEAANCSRADIMDAVQRGELPTTIVMQHSRRRRINAGALEAWVRRCTQQQAGVGDVNCQ